MFAKFLVAVVFCAFISCSFGLTIRGVHREGKSLEVGGKNAAKNFNPFAKVSRQDFQIQKHTKYFQFSIYSDTHCKTLAQQFAFELNTCIVTGNPSLFMNATLGSVSDVYGVALNYFSDPACSSISTVVPTDVQLILKNQCIDQTRFTTVTSLSNAPHGVTGGGTLLFYPNQTTCVENKLSQAVVSEYNGIGACLMNGPNGGDYVISSCSNQAVGYVGFPSNDGSCTGTQTSGQIPNSYFCQEAGVSAPFGLAGWLNYRCP